MSRTVGSGSCHSWRTSDPWVRSESEMARFGPDLGCGSEVMGAKKRSAPGCAAGRNLRAARGDFSEVDPPPIDLRALACISTNVIARRSLRFGGRSAFPLASPVARLVLQTVRQPFPVARFGPSRLPSASSPVARLADPEPPGAVSPVAQRRSSERRCLGAGASLPVARLLNSVTSTTGLALPVARLVLPSAPPPPP